MPGPCPWRGTLDPEIAAAGREHARDLAQRARGARQAVQDDLRVDRVELRVLEGERLGIRRRVHVGGRPENLADPDGVVAQVPWRNVRGHDMGVAGLRLGQGARIAEPAADLEEPARAPVDDGRQPVRVAPFEPVPLVHEEPAPGRQPRFDMGPILVDLHRVA